MHLPTELDKAAAATKAKLVAEDTRILHVMQRDELTLINFFKEHAARIIAGVVVSATLITAFWLTRQ